MMMPNGFTYMTDEERKVLERLRHDPNPVAIRSLSRCPSQEFLLTAVFLCPSIIRFVHNQSWWLRMLAVTLDKTTAPYVNGMTQEIQKAADDPDSRNKIDDLKMPDYLRNIYKSVTNKSVVLGISLSMKQESYS